MNRVKDRIAIVTGGATGIGRATALVLAREGARVVIADINMDGAAETAALIEASGGEAVALSVDVGDELSIQGMIQAGRARYGGLHILVNNAALTRPDHIARDSRVTEMDIGVWDRTMAVTLRSAMLCSKHAIPLMLESGTGSIVNISSGAALGGSHAMTAYAVAKSGVHTLTLYIATQFGKRNVRCNCIAPGIILTPTAQANMSEAHMERAVAGLPTPRLGDPIDIAETVLFLASDEARYVNGQIISVDGGMHAQQPHVEHPR